VFGGVLSDIPISVSVPTRNRPRHIEACVRSVLANREEFELIVVDQSDTDASQRALEAFAGDPRLRYVKSETRGVSRSRNIGIEMARGSVIAFTDDDCRVAEDWVATHRRLFESDPDAAVVFGRVVVPDGVDGRSSYAAMFEPSVREYRNAFPAVHVQWGIGANMAIRRSVFERVGAFDPFLGPGAPFPAAEEYDLTIRVLASGMKVVNAYEARVLHLGVREQAAARALIQGYGEAIGAALTKHVRLGTKHGARLLASWIAFHGARALRNAVTGQRPTNLRFVGGLLTGVVSSLRQPLDVAHSVYRSNGAP
jgi:glycosyltransferase involved in cell wall biosynthesis